MLQYLFPECRSVDMGVDFSGADTLVAKQRLDDPQVGSPFEQGGGE